MIVNYRSYAEITLCLESLYGALASDVEVIVIDHESDVMGAASLMQRFPWIRLIEVSENPGFAAGVNHGARFARGEYLLLINPDCIVNNDAPHTLATWMVSHPRVGVCGAQVRELDGTVQASARRFPNATTGLAGRTSWLTRNWPNNPFSAWNLMHVEGDQAVDVDWVSGACMMVRRTAFDEVGGLDEQFFLYWEDADLCRRLYSNGWKTVYNPAASVTHLTSRSSKQAPVQSLKAFHRSAFRYFLKHGGRGARAAAPFVFAALQVRLAVKLATLKLVTGRRH